MGETTHTTLVVGGMTCGGCAGNVQRALEAIVGVTSAEVNHVEGNANIVHSGVDKVTSRQLLAVRDIPSVKQAGLAGFNSSAVHPLALLQALPVSTGETGQLGGNQRTTPSGAS